MNRDELNRALLGAHAREEQIELVRLYTLAAEERERARDTDAACFYLTHAFVFALECGAPEAIELNQRLADLGRIHRLAF
ncbi:hypothetical protein CLV88_12623 [Shimia abyssi]|uniref:Tetratricopeptide repeat protein n=1 Tax=Shimia abyssi TaxID=1662395 RepID=A0A2P8F056_9RHOB|nr:hypothetical protein [Shimia abyssi]PSL15104.1 hypothetical protein CLV88_12623 [Shimia abyssi]